MVNIGFGCKLPVCSGLGVCAVNMVTEELVKHKMCQVFFVLHFTYLQYEGNDTDLQVGHAVMRTGKATLTHTQVKT